MDWSAVSDADRDSLHTLPLAIVPLQTPSLVRARLVKNVHLEGMVEMFADMGTGRGLVSVENLPNEFGWPQGEGVEPHPDHALLRTLAALHSYDVYSLRVTLRQHGITVEDVSALTLSRDMIRELTVYMNAFTRPLLVAIYGDADVTINDFKDILALFRDPDVARAREKLQQMADRLEIGLAEIPRFLEDYGDIYLSLSYYRHCLDQTEPVVNEFLAALDEVRGNWQLKNDRNLVQTCDTMSATCQRVVAWTKGRLDLFDQSSANMWQDMSAAKFRDIERQVKGSHAAIGGVLCGLGVKMGSWHDRFAGGAGGPMRWSEFIMTDLRTGFDNIRRAANTATA
ncbi:MAG: hypothetical protein H6907_15570 [Hyphomicrobiales bacterium]|nr:hypothetical protein [Hyphomicrobiales bacterium]